MYWRVQSQTRKETTRRFWSEAPTFELLEQELVMTPLRARITNNRSTDVAARVNLPVIDMGRRVLGTKKSEKHDIFQKVRNVPGISKKSTL